MLKAPLAGVAVVLFGLMVERCCGLQMVGNCTFQVYLEKARECTTAFIRDLQTNTSVACSDIYKDMIECTKDYVRECVKGFIDDSKIEQLLNESAKQLRTEEFYCKDGLFSAPNLTDEQKSSIPCKEEFYSQSRDCGETFQTKFRSNRADTSLCKEFSDAKSCLSVLVTQHCEFDEDVQEILNSAFDEYNPFCRISPPPEDEPKAQDDQGYVLNPQTNEEELDAIGQCSVTAQLNRTRKCITVFVRSLQRDPLGNCSLKYNDMQDCIVCMLRSCLTGYGLISESDIQVQIENTRNQTNPEEFYCRGLLEAPKVSSDNEDLECDRDFYEREVECMKEFNDTFNANASDSNLCGKFAGAKQCLRDLITNSSYCSTNSRNASFEIALVFDEFNPFCPGSKDPSDDGSIPAEEEDFTDPCLVESPVSSLLRSKGNSRYLSHVLHLLIYLMAGVEKYLV